MNVCYLCGKEFNEDIKKHDEHIIQQSVGGNLTENDILCSSCGGSLGKEIDVPFSKIFDGIATRLDIKKDRNNNKQSSTNGTYRNLKYRLMSLSWSITPKKMNLLDFQYQYKYFCNEIREIEVIWKNFKVTPLKPFHKYTDNHKQVIIYANQKQAKQYKKKIEKEISENFQENEKPEITFCDDLEGVIEYPFKMNNKAFKRGLAKIAIGFASKHNIQRENLPLVLEIDNKTKQGKILDEIPTIQFYPLGIIDRLIEIQKNEFEHYPFHNLILFTLDYDPKISNGKKVLMCYIELFSTFQWYVVLNDVYNGESIYEFYAQQILKKDDYIVELGRRYYKERNIWLQPLGITEEYIEKKYNCREDRNKTRWDIEEELIQEETIKQKYKFDFEGYIHDIVSGISNQVSLVKQKEQFQKPEFRQTHFGQFVNNKYLMKEYEVFDDIENIMNFKQNLDLFFSQKYNEEFDDYDEIFSILSYRRFFYHDCLMNYYTELLENNQRLEQLGALKAYGYNKMNMLNRYIQDENIKSKTQQNLAPNR
ncbi:hypothetical protein MNB_SV-3-1248 [hydrothermal vent metagenome]|uniref:HNH endonuclease 5 domain-containing protein n=1 Tax=hydrothermal vent metagenome TaxID=652676 RepID=A0A1W1CQJ6_9ZZZZ